MQEAPLNNVYIEILDIILQSVTESDLPLEQSGDSAFWCDVDFVRGGDLGKARHGHDVAANGNDEFGARGKPDFTDGDDMMFRSAFEIGICAEAVLCFRNTNGEMTVTLIL